MSRADKGVTNTIYLIGIEMHARTPTTSAWIFVTIVTAYVPFGCKPAEVGQGSRIANVVSSFPTTNYHPKGSNACFYPEDRISGKKLCVQIPAESAELTQKLPGYKAKPATEKVVLGNWADPATDVYVLTSGNTAETIQIVGYLPVSEWNAPIAAETNPIVTPSPQPSVGTPPATPPPNQDFGTSSFTDVAGTAYEKDIAKAEKLGVVAGYSDKTFKPNGSLTKEQAVVMALGTYNAVLGQDGVKIPTGPQNNLPFTDVPASHWSAGALSAALSAGIIPSESKFTPAATLSATMLQELGTALDTALRRKQPNVAACRVTTTGTAMTRGYAVSIFMKVYSCYKG